MFKKVCSFFAMRFGVFFGLVGAALVAIVWPMGTVFGLMRGLQRLHPLHWRHIRMAPRDGSLIIVSDGGAGYPAYWSGAEWHSLERGPDNRRHVEPVCWMPFPEREVFSQL